MRELASVPAIRVLSADRRGSSWPVLVETERGPRFTKLRGAGQGTGAVVAEIVVAELAEALGLNVPERSIIAFAPDIESLDRDGELRALLDASAGQNLGFAFLDGARALTPKEIDRVNRDDAAAIVWLDGLVMNPDRTHRNPNLMWWHDQLWLIDHGAALGFQYAWSSVDETSIGMPMAADEPHILRSRVADLDEWDPILAARLSRDVVDTAVAHVPDDFLSPLLPAHPDTESLERRRAAYSAFLWKRLKEPRRWVGAEATPSTRARRGAPAWLTGRSDRR